MTWTTITLNVTTPLFNGTAAAQGPADSRGKGAAPDDEPGLRVSSLRGAVRYWFRALAWQRVGNRPRVLAALERRVFGSTGAASPVRMRIPPPPVNRTTGGDWTHGPGGEWIGYLLGQGHYSAPDRTVTVRFLPPGPRSDITLKVRFGPDDRVNALVMAGLWLVCAYGGVGARTRRGFGGLRITGVDGDVPAPWRDGRLLTPGLEHYTGLSTLEPVGPVAECLPLIDALLAEDGARPEHDEGRRPLYPALSREHTACGTSLFTGASWHEVAAHTGEQFRRARATRDNSASRTRYEPRIKTPEHLSVVKGSGTAFPLGAFGLPVGFSKDGRKVAPADASGELRRASPLWLRFVGEGNRWRLFSFAFYSEFLPGAGGGGGVGERGRQREDGGHAAGERGGPRVYLWRGSRRERPLITDNGHVRQRAGEWIRRMGEEEAPFG